MVLWNGYLERMLDSEVLGPLLCLLHGCRLNAREAGTFVALNRMPQSLHNIANLRFSNYRRVFRLFLSFLNLEVYDGQGKSFDHSWF
jgi:hypothetical protein